MVNWREKAVLNVPEAAEVLGISRVLAYELANNGKLPCLRLGEKRVVIPVKAFKEFLGE